MLEFSTQMFRSVSSVKFEDISAKLFFPCILPNTIQDISPRLLHRECEEVSVIRSYSRHCKGTLLFIVGNALISERLKTVGDALDIRARCTKIISRSADGSVEEEDK